MIYSLTFFGSLMARGMSLVASINQFERIV
jgi:hypothetical protein